MNVNLLIDAIVRQTTVLIAQLATAAGSRATLAHTANQVFLDLVRELKDQGVGNKVIADMFGLALRTYHAKVQRLSESTTVRGRSLWEATLEYIQEHGTVLQTDVLRRFARDDEATVRGVLTDLVESGIVFRTGRGTRTTFRAADPEEFVLGDRESGQDGVRNLVWIAVSRSGPASVEELSEVVPLEAPALAATLDDLVREGRVQRVEQRGEVRYRSDECVIPLGATAGWEAAVFDHYQAMVTALCTKLRMGSREASSDDTVGGSTYGFSVWEGHPHYETVLGFLKRTRADAVALREQVAAHNASNRPPDGNDVRVVAYVGQTVIRSHKEEETS